MSLLTVQVPGMTCRHCVRQVTSALRDVPGVLAVLADAATTTVVLHGMADHGDVLAALATAGFPGTVLSVAGAPPGEVADG